MKIAFYNQMFALNGNKFFSTISAHYSVHFRNKSRRFWEKVDIDKTLEIIKKTEAEVVGIAEVLEGQELKLQNGLVKLGYKHVFFGQGHRTKLGKKHVKIAIASRIKCQKIEINGFPLKNKFGGGGGIVGCYLPDLDTTLVNVHLAAFREQVHSQQIKFLVDYLKNLKGKIVLMGDFNQNYKSLKSFFPDLELASGEIISFSLTPVLRKFKNEDIDHIFVKGLRPFCSGSLEGFSDHRLIYADLK